MFIFFLLRNSFVNGSWFYNSRVVVASKQYLLCRHISLYCMLREEILTIDRTLAQVKALLDNIMIFVIDIMLFWESWVIEHFGWIS